MKKKKALFLMVIPLFFLLAGGCSDDSSSSDNPFEDLSISAEYTKCSTDYDLDPDDGDTIDLGQWTEGWDLIVTFTIENSGVDSITLTSKSLTSNFTALDTRANDMSLFGGSAWPVVLGPGVSVSFSFSFAPDVNASLDSHYASVLSIVVEDAGTLEITITGDSIDDDPCP